MSMFTSVVVPIIACVGVGACAGVWATWLYRRRQAQVELEEKIMKEATEDNIIRSALARAVEPPSIRPHAPHPLKVVPLGRPRNTGYRATHAQINSTREGEDEFLLKQMLLYEALNNSEPVDRPSTDDYYPTDKELKGARPFCEVFPDLAESIRSSSDSSSSSSSYSSDSSSSSSCDSSSSSSSYDSGSSSSGSFD